MRQRVRVVVGAVRDFVCPVARADLRGRRDGERRWTKVCLTHRGAVRLSRRSAPSPRVRVPHSSQEHLRPETATLVSMIPTAARGRGERRGGGGAEGGGSRHAVTTVDGCRANLRRSALLASPGTGTPRRLLGYPRGDIVVHDVRVTADETLELLASRRWAIGARSRSRARNFE